MNKTIRACAQALGATAAGLLLSGAALAQAETKPAAPAAASTFTSNQIVVRDAATGQLRAATPAEANSLSASSKTTADQPIGLVQRAHASGARGVRLTDEFMNHHMLARQPDGSFATVCLHSAEDAAKFHQQPMLAKPVAIAPTE